LFAARALWKGVGPEERGAVVGGLEELALRALGVVADQGLAGRRLVRILVFRLAGTEPLGNHGLLLPVDRA
jgi:hypothetical protein